MVEPDAPMVGRYQNQPVLGLEVGAARQGFHHVRHKAIRSFNGADVLRDGSIESVPMPIDVHVVKVQEYSVGNIIQMYVESLS